MTGLSTGDVRGVVLAGGESTRFGEENKALAHFAGEPLIARVVSALRGTTGSAPLLAARSAERADELHSVLPPLPTISDDVDFEGPIAGLVAAAEAVSTPWIVVTGCDMPLVSEPAVQVLLDHATRDVDAVVPDDSGHLEPLFGAYRTAAVRKYRSNVAPSAGPQRLLDELATVRTLSTDSYPVLGRAIKNVNTKAELETLTETMVLDGHVR
ncbi:molybdenum cofactor guanylyltransferase [Haloferax sp. YSMS24]|uniref:molybdenum cofactor guanylyltransferase n=1 Tax=Haloferax sp. YSMS24 TaxID=3388425 RepID=UPI00398D5B77